YVDAIRHSYWVHDEFDYTSDIQDMMINLSEEDKSIVTRAMLAISQIENTVKMFWGNVYHHIPKPEIASVGATFSDSEARHQDAYSHLLELLGLQKEFESLLDVPVMADRVRYLTEANEKSNSTDPKEYFESLILFSMMIENVSLFSQFFIIMSYNKHANMLKGMSNVIEATSKEEACHFQFGADLINIIKKENPQWWTEDLKQRVLDFVSRAGYAEGQVVDWIYEKGDSSIIPKSQVHDYIGYKVAQSLESIGIPCEDKFFEDELSNFKWFEEEIVLTKNHDFFNKRSTAYNKMSQTITADSIF
ncbi:MAG TPA: ribonucleotide-diphosphate reductase subunit beta, partial [Tissierellaceae bacterium]|nr:ribonucleotide-diphosphate reductase subunit beta [Tissierellaceae bacterium]